VNPITNNTKNKGKYNMIPEFCKKDLTPYFQNTIKPIVLVITNQLLGPDLEAAHLPTPSYHHRHRRHTGLSTPNECPPRGVRTKNLFQTIGHAGDGEEQAVPPNEDPREVDPTTSRTLHHLAGLGVDTSSRLLPLPPRPAGRSCKMR
jgi:hypothetical protein